MSRRLDIEITSLSGEQATWRAAGAKLPKGVVATSLLGEGAAVGTVLRAEIEQYMEGTEVVAVTAPKQASPLDKNNERIQLAPKEVTGPDVVVSYAPKGRGGKRPERGEGRSERGEGRSERGGSKPGARPRSDAPRTPRTDSKEGRTERRPARTGARPGPRGPVEAPVATIYRNALLASLSPEQLAVAEQLLRGGLPAVRKAVAEQNQTATAQGRPTINAEVIERIADELIGKTNLALWKDRAAGAITAGKELRLRDLRPVVTSAKTVHLDDEGRVQLKDLQTQLTARIEALRVEWTAKMAQALASADVLESLRLAARTPDISTQINAADAQAIVDIASAALTSECPAERWIAIVTAAADSPVRRQIKPLGIPDSPECKAAAVKFAGSIPAFAKMLGMRVPPPPPPTSRPSRPTRRPATRRS
ncbi:MAG: hypothetical protein WCJ82_07275 [Actinomycetota bacterium]